MKTHFVSDKTRNIVTHNGQIVFARNDNIVRLTFSVGDTSPRLTISIQQDNLNW